jgi:hypothetical protein
MTRIGWSPRYRQVVLRAAFLVVVVLAVAGCGGDSEPSASEDYANSVCSSFSTWLTDVQATTQSVTDAGLATTKDDIQSAVNDVGDATDKLANDLQAAGAPETEDGNKAKSELDDLTAQLRKQLETIQGSLDSNASILSIASTVSTAVSVALTDVEMTYEQLKSLDPAGELRDAFENGDDCKSLEKQVDELRS